MAKLTFEISEDLRHRLRLSCFKSNTTVRDLLTLMIEQHLKWEDHAAATAPVPAASEVAACSYDDEEIR